MTVGAPDPLCCCPIHCTPAPEVSLREQALRIRAASYAYALEDGNEIDGDWGGTDHDYIADFAAYLPEALLNAGFTIHTRLEAGRVITIVRRGT